MIKGIGPSLSALHSFQKKVQSTANNIANLETDGYKKSRVTLEEAEPDGVKATVETVDQPGPLVLEQTADGEQLVEQSNVELTEEIPQLILSKRAFQANLKVIESENEMIGSLLDVKG